MPNQYLQDISIPLAVLEHNHEDGLILRWANEAWWIITDTTEETCIDQQINVWADEGAQITLANSVAAIANTQSGSRFVLDLNNVHGPSVYDASLNVSLAHCPKGEYPHYILTLQDLTFEHQMQQRIQLQRREHERLVEHMEQFMSFAAHDLRSPMRNVQMIADMMLDDFVDHGDGKIEMIHMLDEIGERASKTIHDLLMYSQSQSIVETNASCSLSEIRDHISAVLNPQGHHTILFNEATCTTDLVALRVILQNLIDNAIKHSGLSRTLIMVEVIPHDQDMIQCNVTNTGVCQPKQNSLSKESILNRHESGFGLMGIKRLIEKRGGELESIPPKSGAGAEFRFRIPGQIVNHSKESLKKYASQ